MYQEEHIYGSSTWKIFYRACLLGMLCLALMCLGGRGAVPTAYADGVPGGNVADPGVRAVDIAKPAVVRIITIVIGQLSVTFSNGQSVTFPTTSQQGINGYPLVLSGTGAFISAHGDLLTADHVVNPVADDKQGLDQGLDQLAAQDIADYINQNLKPATPVSPDQVAQQLASGQLVSSSQYQQQGSRIYLSTDFSGPLTSSTIRGLPASDSATVDQVKQHSPFSALDVAIIHVSGMDNMPMLQLGNASAVQEQDNLKVIGFPGAADIGTKPTGLLTSSINGVLVSSIKSTDSGAPLIQVDGNIGPGDSGGPALDNNGNVVGIVSFGPAQGGGTGFLRSSDSAKPLLQAANISTTPSNFQQLWSKAFNDYSSKAAGHWHMAEQELTQIQSQFPHFQAVSPFLQYATTQAQNEQASANSGQSNAPGSVLGINPLWLIIGGVILLCIVLFGGMAVARRKKPAVAASGSYSNGQSYGAFPANTPLNGQSYGTLPANAPLNGQSYGTLPSDAPTGFSSGQNMPGAVPQTPSHPGLPSAIPQTPPVVYQQPAGYGQGYPSSPATPLPGQPGYQPRVTVNQPQPAQQTPGMAAFGAPHTPSPSPAPASPDPDATLRSDNAAGVPQWRTWPCGHVNRLDARFCGICGAVAPPVPSASQAKP